MSSNLADPGLADPGDQVRIVAFASHHAEAWRSLNAAWIERFFAIEPKDQLVLDDPQGQVIAKGGMIFVAERGDAAIGCVALAPMPDGGFELAKMTVAETARGSGVGRRLIEACIAAAREAGAHRLYLESNTSLTPALTLYRACGFVHLPAQPTPYARADVWMELRLV
jgi:putative acetyltransferase